MTTPEPSYAWADPRTDARLSVKFRTIQEANEHTVSNAVLMRCDAGEWSVVPEEGDMEGVQYAVEVDGVRTRLGALDLFGRREMPTVVRRILRDRPRSVVVIVPVAPSEEKSE
jgi:hypothetical protein